MNLSDDERSSSDGEGSYKPPTPQRKVSVPKINTNAIAQEMEETKAGSKKVTPVVTPRKAPTPRDFMPKPDEKKKGGGLSFLKSPLSLFNKFTGVNKSEKMKEIKDAEDKYKRE